MHVAHQRMCCGTHKNPLQQYTALYDTEHWPYQPHLQPAIPQPSCPHQDRWAAEEIFSLSTHSPCPCFDRPTRDCWPHCRCTWMKEPLVLSQPAHRLMTANSCIFKLQSKRSFVQNAYIRARPRPPCHTVRTPIAVWTLNNHPSDPHNHQHERVARHRHANIGL